MVQCPAELWEFDPNMFAIKAPNSYDISQSSSYLLDIANHSSWLCGGER